MATRNCHSAVDAAAASGETMLADIADRNSAEDAIRESEERFRLVANTAPVLIWMSDVDKLCTYFNEPWLEFTGEPLESQLGNGWANGVHPEDLERCLGIYTEAFDRRERFRMEYRLRRQDGEYRWILDIGVPRFNQHRSFVGYIGSCIDVTELKHAEQALRESEGRFRLAVAFSASCKRPFTIRQNTVGHRTSKWDCGEHRMRSISSSATPAQALIAKGQRRVEGSASSAWRSG